MGTNPGLFGDLIRQFETDAVHIIGQPVRILLNDPVHLLAVLFVNSQG